MNLLNLNEAGVAIQGYDPVAYFSNEAAPGNSDIKSTYEGATYYFVSNDHKTQFEANPTMYIPQYGGFCAVAVSEGKTFPIDPKSYSIEADKLYLFYNGSLGNTKPQWLNAPEARRTSADAHWQSGEINVVYPTLEY